MAFIILFQFAVIVLLIYLLISKDREVKSMASLLPDSGAESKSITYSWKLDSARKTKLKGHLTLRFDPEEIEEQRMNNPFALLPNHDTEDKLRKMYFYMLGNPRTLMHAAEVVKYINRECSRRWLCGSCCRNVQAGCLQRPLHGGCRRSGGAGREQSRASSPTDGRN